MSILVIGSANQRYKKHLHTTIYYPLDERGRAVWQQLQNMGSQTIVKMLELKNFTALPLKNNVPVSFTFEVHAL